ncbi:peptidoglycan-binding domain-containing protein [Micromonospora chersina]
MGLGDGMFGTGTEAAVNSFQQQNTLAPNGIVVHRA